jgi:hypothetical protein
MPHGDAAWPDIDSHAHYEARIVHLQTAEGQQLAGRLSDGWAARMALLLDAFEPQVHPAWCGYASLRVALRSCGAVRVPKQQEMYQMVCRDASIKQPRPDGSMAGGLSMSQLERILHLVATPDRGVAPAAELVYGAERSQFEARLIADLCASLDDGSVILVNLLRTVGGRYGGHWSPLGGLAVSAGGEAYALLLDVAAHRLGLHWVPLRMLVACCCTLNVHGTPRGYLRVSATRHPRGAGIGDAACRIEAGAVVASAASYNGDATNLTMVGHL